MDTKKALSRRAIEQLGYIKDVDSLVVLSGTTIIIVSVDDRELST